MQVHDTPLPINQGGDSLIVQVGAGGAGVVYGADDDLVYQSAVALSKGGSVLAGTAQVAAGASFSITTPAYVVSAEGRDGRPADLQMIPQPVSADSTDALLGVQRLAGEQRVRRRADLTLHPTPPVRTSVTGTPPAVPANMRFVPWDSPLLRWSTPLVPAVTGASAPGTPSIHGMMTSSHLTGTVDESLQGPMPYRLDVMIDGSSITLPLGSPLNASPKCHLYVDGMLATADEELLSGGGMAMHTWAFADAGPRELCFMLKNASVKGVYVPVNGQVFAPPWPQGPRVLFVGDSITESAVATSHSRGFAHLLAWELGFDNYSVSAWGGTGYVNQSASPVRLNLLQRITDITDLVGPNDLVVYFLGANDDPPMDVRTNARACYQAVKATGAKQVVFGPWYTEASAVGDAYAHAQIRLAAADVGIPFVPTMNFDRWMRGTGHAGNPVSSIGPAITGDGNADRYLSGATAGSPASQSVHPVNLGHVAERKWAAPRVRDAGKPTYRTPLVVPAAFPIATAPSLWYDETGHSTTTDGVGISQWTDKSGSGAHLVQATAGKQPLRKNNILNGLPVARFDGIDDELVAATGAQVQHVFALAKYSAATFNAFNGLFMGTANNNPDTVLMGGAAQTLEVQSIPLTVTGTLNYDGLVTAALPGAATAAQVASALQALQNIGAAGVTAAGGPLGTAAVTVTFNIPGTRPLITVPNASGVVTRTTTGVAGKFMYNQVALTTVRFWRDGEENSRQEMRGPMNVFGLLEMCSTEWTNPLIPRVGSQAGLGGRFWNGDDFEFQAYPTILVAAERLAVRNFLLNKAGFVNWETL